MTVQIRRVVTGRTADGKSVFTSVGEAKPAPAAGMDFYNLWGTQDSGAIVDSNPAENPKVFPFFPDGHGTRLVAVVFTPFSETPAPELTAQEAAAAAADDEAAQPGLLGAFEPDNPGMHTTDSVDYGVCVDGEVWLELDDGEEVRITPGTVVVQRGTRHAWRNKSDKPATMIYTLVGAERL